MIPSLRDLGFAWRALRRRPLASAAILATLALGLGAQAAVFRVFDAVVLRPLPFADDERLVRLYIEPRERSGERLSPGVDVLLALQRETRSFAAVIGQRYMNLTLRRADGPERLTVIGVTAGWAPTLGVAPLLGRAFSDEEERAGMVSAVALVGHATWQGLLGGDPAILGRRLELGERTFTVVGVMPPGFAFPYDAQVWVPLRPELDAVGPWGFFIPARLAPGVGLDEASRELAALAERLPDLDGRTLTAVPLREVLLGDGMPLARLLLAAVVLLVLLVCANLANLYLVRSLARGGELAVRAALGAGRSRLARLLLGEALLVSLLGAVLGCGVALLAQPVLAGVVPEDLYRLGGLPPVDLRGALFVLAVGLGSGLAFGVLPALRAVRQQPARLLRAGQRSVAGGHRLRGALVTVEVALALVLVVVGGLLVRDLWRRQRLDLGYDARGLLTASVSLATEADPDLRSEKVARLLGALAALPEVKGVGATCIFPSPSGNFVTSLLAEGEAADATPRLVNHRLVTPGFFAALDLPVVRGRGITSADVAGAEPVAVVSASLAARRWPGVDPLGKRLRQVRAGEPEQWATVVGVVGDVAEFYDVEDTWYLPLAQHAASPRATDLVFALRARGELADLPARVRRAVGAVDPGLAVFDVGSPAATYRESLAAQRASGLLALAFAGLALLVAVVGVYAAMAAWVAERRREVAIRLAVGGTPRRLLGELSRRGLGLVALGMLAGSALTLAAGGLLGRLLAGVDLGARGPLLVLAAALLAVPAAAACLLPAWRALRRDPLPSLRGE